MDWREKWYALRARTEGLIEAGNQLTRILGEKNSDYSGTIKKHVVPEIRSIAQELTAFESTHGNALPEQAREVLALFNKSDWADTSNDSHWPILGKIPAVAIFRAKFDFLIQDVESARKARSERALEHLQRLLAVDDDVRRKWNEAFTKGETECEKLGSVHLLAHGIWAFKAKGKGAETDLVFGEQSGEDALRTDSALVLTEWKCANNETEAVTLASKAIAQTREYETGILGGLELRQTRYIILVTKAKSKSHRIS